MVSVFSVSRGAAMFRGGLSGCLLSTLSLVGCGANAEFGSRSIEPSPPQKAGAPPGGVAGGGRQTAADAGAKVVTSQGGLEDTTLPTTRTGPNVDGAKLAGPIVDSGPVPTPDLAANPVSSLPVPINPAGPIVAVPPPAQATLPTPKPDGATLPPAPGKPPETKQDVVDACAQGARIKKPFKLDFVSTETIKGSICKWQSSPSAGNQKASDTIRGHFKQEISIALPDNAIVCSSKLSTSDATLWSYDDEVVLTLNGVVLLASQDAYLWRRPAQRQEPIHAPFGAGFVFDWEKLFKEELPNIGSTTDSIYCYGTAPGAAGCEVPLTQKQGRVKLDLATQDVADLSLKAVKEKKLTYGLLVTGDNDPDIDCKHSGIVIEGQLEYVQPR